MDIYLSSGMARVVTGSGSRALRNGLHVKKIHAQPMSIGFYVTTPATQTRALSSVAVEKEEVFGGANLTRLGHHGKNLFLSWIASSNGV